MIEFKALFNITFYSILLLCILRAEFVTWFLPRFVRFVPILCRFRVHLSKFFYICLNQLKKA